MNTLEEQVRRQYTLTNGSRPSGNLSSTAPQTGGLEARVVVAQGRPDPEVVSKATRRRFPIAYKRRIVQEVDACQEVGGIGAILRREGLYHACLARFRKHVAKVDKAAAKTANARSAGQRSRNGNARASSNQVPSARIAELERKNKRLERRLEQAQHIISVQKKLSELLGISLESNLMDLNELDEVSE